MQMNPSDTSLVYVSAEPATAGTRLARAFDGVTPRVVGFVAVVATACAMTRVVNRVIVAIVDGHVPQLLVEVLLTLLCYALVAATMLAAAVPALNLGPQSGWRRTAVLAAAIIAGAAVAVAIRVPFVGAEFTEPLPFVQKYLLLLHFQGITFAALTAMLVAVALIYRRTRESHDATHRTDVDRSNLERTIAQARIQVLQAQIEPHFLFNTLANVRRLYETDPGAGHRMLDNLMRYFEIALPQMRAGSATLGHEAALIESYLNVQQIRIGRRLAFSIEIPKALEAIEVPPMMLLTLVENALKHGIAPQPKGGTVRVVAEAAGERLILSVVDTGRGLIGAGGGGTGLSNIRARLAASFGDRASLSIRGNVPEGIVATIVLPLGDSVPVPAGMHA